MQRQLMPRINAFVDNGNCAELRPARGTLDDAIKNLLQRCVFCCRADHVTVKFYLNFIVTSCPLGEIVRAPESWLWLHALVATPESVCPVRLTGLYNATTHSNFTCMLPIDVSKETDWDGQDHDWVYEQASRNCGVRKPRG